MRMTVVFHRHSVLAAIVFAPILSVHADNYVWDFNNASDPATIYALPGSHHFQVDNVPSNYSTEWKVAVWTEICESETWWNIYTETDPGSDPTVTPKLTRDFTRRQFRIYATIRSAPNQIENQIVWYLNIEAPDMMLTHPATTPDPVQLDTPFTVQTKVRNFSQHFTASAGPDTGQEAHFFLDGEFIGSVSYDDVPPGYDSALDIESPPMVVHKVGTHTIRVVCDATDQVDEIVDFGEMNNDVYANILVKGLVPDVVGMRLSEARKALRDAGVELGDITKTADDSIPHNQVVDQNPDAGTEVGLDPEVDITINIKPCKIDVLQPAENAGWQIGSIQTITWDRFEACREKVRIELWQDDQFVATIDRRTKNDEAFEWLIDANSVTPGDGYFVRIYLGKKYSDSPGTFSLMAP